MGEGVNAVADMVISQSAKTLRVYEHDGIPEKKELEDIYRRRIRISKYSFLLALSALGLAVAMSLAGATIIMESLLVISAIALPVSLVMFLAAPGERRRELQVKTRRTMVTLRSSINGQPFLRPVKHPDNKLYARYYPGNINVLVMDLQTTVDNHIVGLRAKDIIHQLQYIESVYSDHNYPVLQSVMLQNMLLPLIEQAVAAKEAEHNYVLNSNIQRMLGSGEP